MIILVSHYHAVEATLELFNARLGTSAKVSDVGPGGMVMGVRSESSGHNYSSDWDIWTSRVAWESKSNSLRGGGSETVTSVAASLSKPNLEFL